MDNLPLHRARNRCSSRSHNGARLGPEETEATIIEGHKDLPPRDLRSGNDPREASSLGLFQSFSEARNRYAYDSFPFEPDDYVIVEYSAVGRCDGRSEANVKYISGLIIVHVKLLKLANC